MRILQQGDPAGTVWRPGETDVSIRPGWFSHPAEHERVRTAEQLVELFFTSVGRNSKLLLNVPPTVEGLLHEIDVAKLAEMRGRLNALFRDDLTTGSQSSSFALGDHSALAEIDLGRTASVGIIDLREDITRGQVIARHSIEGRLDGDWQVLARGTTIGFRRLHRLAPVAVRHVRLVIEDAVGVPRPVRLGLYAGG